MKNYYFINGFGQSRSLAGAVNKALELSYLSQCRPLVHTYSLPKDSLFLEPSQIIPSSDVVDAILATAEGLKGSVISAGVILGDLYRNGKKDRTLICKKSGEFSQNELEEALNSELLTIGNEFAEGEHEIKNIKIASRSLKVDESHGSVVVGIGFTDKYLPLATQHPEVTPFLGKPGLYEKSKFVVVPVLYEHPIQIKENYGPLSLLKASKFMEDYDLETDQQLSSIGVHTAEVLISSETPALFVEAVEARMVELLNEGKFPIFLGEDQTLTIGAMRGAKEVAGAFSVLHLGASTQLRTSFDGSSYSQACALKKGQEYATDVVQVGIRATSNREKRDLQYDKIFFASDILDEKDDYWMEDVVEELTQSTVYMTIDASVFDPGVIMSKRPEPMGLSYGKVIKLLKLVVKKKKIIGFDFIGLNPQVGELSSELAAARLVYQTLCFLTKKS